MALPFFLHIGLQVFWEILALSAILLEYMGNQNVSLFESFIEKRLAIW